jgi:hypothetical protein
MRRTLEPPFSDLGRCHGAGRNILADNEVRTVAGAFHAHGRAAAVASAMIQHAKVRHFARVRECRAGQRCAQGQRSRWGEILCAAAAPCGTRRIHPIEYLPAHRDGIGGGGHRHGRGEHHPHIATAAL